MGHPFPVLGFARRFKTDLQILTHTGTYHDARLSDRAVALDRIAGTSVLVCVAAMLAWVVATHSNLWNIPSAMASSAYNATFGAHQAAIDPSIATRPMTARDVRLVQSKLKQLGFEPGPLDGLAGHRTLEALNRYRAAKHLDLAAKIDYVSAVDLLD